MKDKFEINLMYTELRIQFAKSKISKLYWCINHDLTVLAGRLIRVL